MGYSKRTDLQLWSFRHCSNHKKSVFGNKDAPWHIKWLPLYFLYIFCQFLSYISILKGSRSLLFVMLGYKSLIIVVPSKVFNQYSPKQITWVQVMYWETKLSMLSNDWYLQFLNYKIGRTSSALYSSLMLQQDAI